MMQARLSGNTCRVVILALAMGAGIGCGESDSGSTDSGSTGDATNGGGDGGPTGAADSGRTEGPDGGSTGAVDGGTTGGTTGGTDGSDDAGEPFTECPTTYAGGCTAPTDLTKGGGAVSFDFESVFNGPTCIKIKTGQTLTLSKVSTNHPIAPQDCGPATMFATEETAPVVRKFSTAGIYGIHCTRHGIDAMALAIQVVP